MLLRLPGGRHRRNQVLGSAVMPRPSPTFLRLLLLLLLLLLLARADLLDECRPPDPKVVLEPYTPPEPKADIIIAIDTTGSMGQESAYLMDNINGFGQHLEDSGIDYRVFLVGQARGCCSLCVKPPLASSTCAKSGPRFLQSDINVGEYAMSRLLGQNMYDAYKQFLRPEASKTFVAITDDDSHSWKGICGKENNEACANQWKDALHQLDTLDLFTPTDKLPMGFIFHAITGHTCRGQPGYGHSYGLANIVRESKGTMYQICKRDWSPMFVEMAKTVESTTDASAACTQTVPLSDADPSLLIGDLEPDTAFDMKYAYENTTTKEVGQIVISRSKAGGGGLECPAVTHPPGMFYKLDSVDDPRVVTLCDSACELVKNSVGGTNQAQGNLSFTFKPVSKIKSLTVSGRGLQSEALFGAPRTMRPAHTYPVHHPVLFRGAEECSNGASARPTIPETGEILFVNKSGGCPQVPGSDLFFAVDPRTGRSQTFASSPAADGITMYFFVNTAGKTYFGLQIGHAANNFTAGYAVVDVILSGSAKSMQASWVLQDGISAGTVDGFINPDATTGRGRARMQNAKGRTAGGVLGPLPAFNFCVDVNVVEASQTIKHARIVDFVPGSSGGRQSLTKFPCSPSMSTVDQRVLEAGGIRFCANTCTGNATKNTSNSVLCYTTNKGALVCPGDSQFDRGNKTEDNYDDIDFNKTYEVPVRKEKESSDSKDDGNSGSLKEVVKDGERDTGTDQSTTTDNKLKWWWLAAIGGGVCLVLVGVAAGIVRVRKMRYHAGPLGGGNDGNGSVEMSHQAQHRRLHTAASAFSSFGSGQYWVPPPPDEGMKETTVQNRHKRTNTKAQKHARMASRISAGFDRTRPKRVSSFNKFLATKGLPPASRNYSLAVKKRGPSMRHVARSNWDVFMSAEHNREYYHNRKTGETLWICPPEIVASLGMPQVVNTNATAALSSGVAISIENPMATVRKEVGTAAVGQPVASVGTYKMYHGPQGHPYYCNTLTGDVTWVLPAGSTLLQDDQDYR